MILHIMLIALFLAIVGAAQPAPAPSAVPTAVPSAVKSFSATCGSIAWQLGTLFTTTLVTSNGYTIAITGPAPACTWGSVETITVNP